ncbi:hypothetical protein M413DRAFT_9100 [Hebeloma cylindrosporum]|uniref:Uncharacterized protein n=1 Tax=Hebeloma cylindrosporum TaxID=76867 RepID=A0A0C3C7J7_HEBCY|nr:hypothetical protein M413DRAFT_9100 [Hebeloma cylindrosporum h7]
MSNTRGPVVLSSQSERVTDVDEELFILYSELQSTSASESTTSFRGLGYVDSHKDVLEIKFELTNPLPSSSGFQTNSRSRKSRKPIRTTNQSVEIEIHQDKTALHSRKGDTGSVVWKARSGTTIMHRSFIDFAQLVLQDYHSDSPLSLFDRQVLNTQNVVELGAGTGFLSIALSPLVRQYTATDIGPLIPLIQKNVKLNFPSWPHAAPGGKGKNVLVEELDWVTLESASLSTRAKIYDTEAQPVDLLLVVDCLYHPSLVSPFLTTVDYLTTPGRTAVIVFSELRAEDVMREFLTAWLSIPGWEIWRIPHERLSKRYVVWLGWKTKDI